MKIIDIYGNEIQESQVDLEKGYLAPTYIVKADAAPVDNVTKFAYADEDYEEAKVYIEHRTTEPPASDTPTWDELAAAIKEGVDSV